MTARYNLASHMEEINAKTILNMKNDARLIDIVRLFFCRMSKLHTLSSFKRRVRNVAGYRWKAIYAQLLIAYLGEVSQVWNP